MIRPKGIAEAVAAVVRARELGAIVELDLYGAPDPANPTSYSQAELRRWAGTPGVAWHGATEDGTSIHREHHIAMLLSAREGLPRGLVEAGGAWHREGRCRSGD
jgi:hypothetical protein